MNGWLEGTVVEQREWAENLFSIYIQADFPTFQAGQFTQLGIMQGEKRIHRPYSFANAPKDELLEFYYNVVPSGVFTPHLKKLKRGDKILLAKKPSGRFVLSSIPQGKTLWFIATGTGVAPFFSLLKDGELWSRFERVVLVRSVRRQIELTHQDLIEALTKQYPQQFYGCNIVTREPSLETFHERIPQLLENGSLENKLGIALSTDSAVMLCGNPAMLNEVSVLLLARDLKEHRTHQPGQILVESYWKDKSSARSA